MGHLLQEKKHETNKKDHGSLTDPLSSEDLQMYTIETLRQMARERGLQVGGLKDEVLHRVRRCLVLEHQAATPAVFRQDKDNV